MTIKEIAGKILLYLYAEERMNLLVSRNRKLNIENNREKKIIELSGDEVLVKSLGEISKSANDIFLAFNYLVAKKFIWVNEDKDGKGSISYRRMGLEPEGIDIIEGIDRGSSEKKEFNVTFNINVENNMNVDSLIKANVGSLLGIGLNL